MCHFVSIANHMKGGGGGGGDAEEEKEAEEEVEEAPPAVDVSNRMSISCVRLCDDFIMLIYSPNL